MQRVPHLPVQGLTKLVEYKRRCGCPTSNAREVDLYEAGDAPYITSLVRKNGRTWAAVDGEKLMEWIYRHGGHDHADLIAERRRRGAEMQP